MTLELTICKASEVVALVNQQEALGTPFDAVISLEHPCGELDSAEEGRAPRLAQILGPKWKDRQVILECWDIEEPVSGIPEPSDSIVSQALAHFDKWRQNGEATRILIHCRSAKARSAALGLILLRHGWGRGSAIDCFAELLRIRPNAAPNMAIVRHGDRILGCDGELIRAVESDPEVTRRRADANAARAHQLESRGIRTPRP